MSQVSATPQVIAVRGARVHHLKHVDVDIPHGQIICLTGVSGSGKSTLARDVLFAEGRRRYLETLSPAMRRLLAAVPRPDVDSVRGLPPVVSVDQHRGLLPRRTTLASITELADWLSVLFARAGAAHCPTCGDVVTRQSPARIVEAVTELETGAKVMLLAPVVRGEVGQHQDIIERCVKQGYLRLRVDGDLVDASEPLTLDASAPHDIDIVIHRVKVKPGIEGRLTESVLLALKEADQFCIVSREQEGEWIDRLYSARLVCPECRTHFPDLQPRTFRATSAHGACAVCEGRGVTGLEDDSAPVPCSTCEGSGLGDFARAVTVGGVNYPGLLSESVGDAIEFVEQLESSVPEWTADRQAAATRLLPAIRSRLRYLERVGLGYLTLDRTCRTLSGGEYQRARLASALGSELTGVCYLIDEPTSGLHRDDVGRLLESIRDLHQQGNTLVIIEHEPRVWEAADLLIDLGPGGGADGGTVVAVGAPEELASAPQHYPESETVRVLSERGRQTPTPRQRRELSESWIELEGASLHNLRDVSVRFPTGRLTAVVGVSGSGKSSLVVRAFVPAARAVIDGKPIPSSLAKSLTGVESVSAVKLIDQAPLGRSGRSNPATALGIWDELRSLFAKTKEAKLRGFTARRFSFNAKGGRCDHCEGSGVRPVPHSTLPDLELPCPYCGGSRFDRATLSVRYKGHSVADVLSLTVSEARDLFQNLAPIRSRLDALDKLGLGYLALGQPATQLSGGEAQRIKLAKELTTDRLLPTVYVLDEPTSGLHPSDVGKLNAVLHGLTERGQTVIVIEHNADVVRAADWVITLGPGAGDAGGQVLAMGTEEA